MSIDKRQTDGIVSLADVKGVAGASKISGGGGGGSRKFTNTTTSSSLYTPMTPSDIDPKELEEARRMAERYHNSETVLDAAGWLMKEAKAQSIMQFGRKTKNLRWFRLSYDMRKLTWLLKWYESEDEDTVLSQCSLDTAKITVVNDGRSVTIGDLITSVDVHVEFPAKKTYR